MQEMTRDEQRILYVALNTYLKLLETDDPRDEKEEYETRALIARLSFENLPPAVWKVAR
jgi:hypothetical protein